MRRINLYWFCAIKLQKTAAGFVVFFMLIYVPADGVCASVLSSSESATTYCLFKGKMFTSTRNKAVSEGWKARGITSQCTSVPTHSCGPTNMYSVNSSKLNAREARLGQIPLDQGFQTRLHCGATSASRLPLKGQTELQRVTKLNQM